MRNNIIKNKQKLTKPSTHERQIAFVDGSVFGTFEGIEIRPVRQFRAFVRSVEVIAVWAGVKNAVAPTIENNQFAVFAAYRIQTRNDK
ncbi:MAG: hypothetical protein RL757_306 [Bacteroidota bacterium]|jgi:hypothetical protein